MIIDDSNTIRRSAEIFLVQAGCQVVLAEDGFDALAKIADHQPQVVFCDIMMPRLDAVSYTHLDVYKRQGGALASVMPPIAQVAAVNAVFA